MVSLIYIAKLQPKNLFFSSVLILTWYQSNGFDEGRVFTAYNFPHILIIILLLSFEPSMCYSAHAMGDVEARW